MLVFVSDHVLRAAQILAATVTNLIGYPLLAAVFHHSIKLGALKE
jgi:hypothetical protein